MLQLKVKTSSSFPPAHAQRMNQSFCTRDKTQGESLARHPTRQRCLTPSLASQLLQDTAMPPAPPRCALRPPAREGAAAAGAAVTVVWPAGGPGGDGGSKTEWKPGGRRRASPGGVCAPEPGLPGAAAAPARGLRCAPGGPGPALGARAPRPCRPAARVCTAAPVPLSAGEPVVVAAAVQDVPAGDWEAPPAGSWGPTTMWGGIPVP